MFEQLTRDNLATYVVKEIGHPRGGARVQIVEVDGRRAILKDIRGAKGLATRVFGRRLMAREFAVYEALAGLDGIPRVYRMLDADAFLMEYVENVLPRKKDARRGMEVPAEVFDRCLALVDEMHRRGVVHLDLRNRKNFLFGSGGRVYIIDFASAVHVPRWLPFRRGVVRLLGAFDRAGVLKMKRQLAPSGFTEADCAVLGRFERIRGMLFPPLLVVRWLRGRRRVRRDPQKHTAS